MTIDKKLLKKKFTEEWKKHYDLDFFKEKGFIRKQCIKCKKFFWTLDTERNTCADSSCSNFEFIGKGTFYYSYTDTWKAIEKYFLKHKHTSIERYPTVCRWRDDLYFTNASIIDFQPYVVSGEIEPPANPLIVPQPSIRFGDIENVGVTGQHYSSFIMFGQHAFNNQKTGLFYWKNEALEHDFNYLTKVIGVKKEDIAFQEDVWAGGGTFGPSIEYCAKGLELGNCVFMQFKELENGFEQLKTKVIDMGAGLERLAWYTNGTPTSYDVTFDEIIQKIIKNAKIEVLDKKTLIEFARIAGSLDIESESLKESKEKIYSMLGLSEKEFFLKIRPLQAIYAVIDHLKTILYTTTDGMLPSNAGGGYNLRMLLRRVFGFNKEFDLNLDYGEIIRMHATKLKPIDETLIEGIETTIKVIEEEEKKYNQSKEKGKKIIESIIEKAKKNQLKEKELIQLYESHGIAIEEIESIAKNEGIKIEVPQNFYGLIARKNEKEKESNLIDVSNYPKTIKLFYEDDELREFTAKVIAVKDKAVILDRTAFYAESGGQEADKGFLNGIEVEDVQQIEGVILHYTKKPEAFKQGMKVEGEIDWNRRQKLRKHHSATHILNAACRKVLGKHVWQAGAHKSENKAHLDITHYKKITEEELNQIEAVANEFISENAIVEKKFMLRNEAEKTYGFRLYQGGFVPGKNIRIVNMQGIDVEACSGIHVNRTGDIGLLKIIKRESIQDGIERITFACSVPAIKYLQEKESLLKETAEILKVPETEIAKAAKKFFDEWKQLNKKVQYLQEKILAQKKEELIKAKEKELKVFIEGIEANNLIALGKEIIRKNEEKTIILSNGFDLIILAGKNSGKNALEELKNILKQVKGKGNGSQEIARAIIEDKETIKKILI